MAFFIRLTISIILSVVTLHIHVVAANNKVNIKSDYLTIQKENLSATFQGSVVLTFDDLKLYSSTLKIHYTDSSNKKEIKEIIIPTKLKAIRNCAQEIIFADSGSFNNYTKKLTLMGNVRILKEGNVLVTDKLVYSAKFKEIRSQDNAK